MFFILFTTLSFKIFIKKKIKIEICNYINNSLLTAKTLKKATNTIKISRIFAKIKIWVT